MTAIEQRLHLHGFGIENQSKVERVEWKDKPLMKLLLALHEHIGNSKTVSDYFAEFDSDFDGVITQSECFDAIKYIISDKGVEDYQIWRICQKLQNQKLKDNTISIE